jgi:hypothetical protein
MKKVRAKKTTKNIKPKCTSFNGCTNNAYQGGVCVARIEGETMQL